MRHRFWELDFLRGIAIILMILFHSVFDLNQFFGFEDLAYDHGFWFYEGRFTAVLFILFVGVISGIIAQQCDLKERFKKTLFRSGRLAAFAFLITAATWFFDPSNTIWFGMLHFLTIAILFSFFFVRFRWLNLVFAGIVFWIGEWLKFQSFGFAIGLPLGLRPVHLQTFDYYPIFPWFTAILIGIFVGQWYYRNRPILFQKKAPGRIARWIGFLGRHSLAIYLIHQPILLALLFLFFKSR
ncbi:DUF1624 domain-containing protein [Candidatus Peregrinibacteria bacterium]|nr:DUF1624 domain-containing protein [Candidatus Peregrinibacteria bacterium]